MRYPWANVALLLLLLAQAATGYLGFVNGRDGRAWLLWLHGSGAYAIVLLLAWKGAIVLDVYRRGTSFDRQRAGFALMGLLLLGTLFSGLLWTFDGPIYLLGFSLLTLHIFLAVPLLLLLAWHVWRLRWILRAPAARSRRLFVRTAALGAAGLAAWWLSGRARHLAGLLGAQRRFTGSYETGSFTGRFPHVSWIADRPPPVDLDDWRLALGGVVRRPLILTYDQLARLSQVEEVATLDCTGGWYSTQVWRGVSLADLLAEAGPLPAARSVTVTAVSGYSRRFSLVEAGRYFLALEVAGQPLDHGHGFPLRLVAPDQRGFNWVKWVARIQVNDTAAFWQPPLPLQ